MPAPRLVFLVAAVVGMLVAVSIASSRDGGRTTDNGPAEVVPATNVRERPTTVEATLPRDEPVKARVGDMIVLRMTPKQFDIAELGIFGVRQNLRANTPTVMRFVAARPGDFDVHLRLADKPLVKLEIGRSRVVDAKPEDASPAPPQSGGKTVDASTAG